MRRGLAVVVSGFVVLALAGCGGSDPTLPDLVGQDLKLAKRTASDAGFDSVVSHDATGDRTQIVDGNWQVCVQTPVPGPVDPDTRIDLGVVRTEETCPGAAPAQTTAPTTAPTTTADAPPPTFDAPSVPDPVQDQGSDGSGSGDSGSGDSGSDDPGSGDALTVNPGSYCSSPGAVGVTRSGTPMVCGPGSDGRDRWRGR